MSETEPITDDLGVAPPAGSWVCQNFQAHPGEEVDMETGPHDGQVCPSCGRAVPTDHEFPYDDGGPDDE